MTNTYFFLKLVAEMTGFFVQFFPSAIPGCPDAFF